MILRENGINEILVAKGYLPNIKERRPRSDEIKRIWFKLIRRFVFAYDSFTRRIDPNEDFNCGQCGKPLLRRVLFCSAECYFESVGQEVL